MSQHDYVVDDASGAIVRADLNSALQALASNNSGASAPSTTYALMWWADTTNSVLKQRNAANSAWAIRARLDTTGVVAKTSGFTVALADFGKIFDCTSGTFTIALPAAATAGDGFWFGVRNSGSGVVTLDGDSSEQIDGAATLALGPGQSAYVHCNAALWRTVGLTKIAGTNIRMGSDAQGDTLYFNGADYARLGAGTNRQVLRTQGVSANPAWADSITRGTQQNLSSTGITFSSLPAGLNRITIMFADMSLSGTDNFLVQLGDSGGVETSGYVSSSGRIISAAGSGVIASTAGYIMQSEGAAVTTHSGTMTLTRKNGNEWTATFALYGDSTHLSFGVGSKTLSAELDRVFIGATGSDTFDSGSVNILYE